ncbi:MAG: DUF922 domain-containing protein [Formosimonas sp.]
MIKNTIIAVWLGLNLSMGGAWAKVDEQLQWKTYPVHLTGQEKNVLEVRNAIYQASPLAQWFPEVAQHHDTQDGQAKPVGVTQFVPSLSYSGQPKADGTCRLSQYAIINSTAIYLPVIASGGKLPAAVKSWFAQEHERIKKHEMIHHGYNQKYLQRMDAYLSQMPYDRSCDALSQVIKDYNSQLRQYFKEIHQRFDLAEFKYHVALDEYDAKKVFNEHTSQLKKDAERTLNATPQKGSAVEATAQHQSKRVLFILGFLVLALLAGLLFYVQQQRKTKP